MLLVVWFGLIVFYGYKDYLCLILIIKVLYSTMHLFGSSRLFYLGKICVFFNAPHCGSCNSCGGYGSFASFMKVATFINVVMGSVAIMVFLIGFKKKKREEKKNSGVSNHIKPYCLMKYGKTRFCTLIF